LIGIKLPSAPSIYCSLPDEHIVEVFGTVYLKPKGYVRLIPLRAQHRFSRQRKNIVEVRTANLLVSASSIFFCSPFSASARSYFQVWSPRPILVQRRTALPSHNFVPPPAKPHLRVAGFDDNFTWADCGPAIASQYAVFQHSGIPQPSSKTEHLDGSGITN
jgi:hypothetical protein